MNGPIAQLVALTCHANWFLGHGTIPSRFFPDNSTCKFCDRVSFVEVKKSWLGKPSERTVTENPDAWFAYLAARKAVGVRLLREAHDNPAISDQMSAGFVGGGGQWMLGVRYPDNTEYWMARWEVWNQQAPDQRIWRVTYGLVARDRSPPASVSSQSNVLGGLESALNRIHAFSANNNCGGFTECFARAIQSLSERTATHGFHKDLYSPGSLSRASEAMLDAAQSAWVFGGMGSWNDMGFDGEKGQEYEESSDALFIALNDAICVSANESCKE
jgi:hypothetical protein